VFSGQREATGEAAAPVDCGSENGEREANPAGIAEASSGLREAPARNNGEDVRRAWHAHGFPLS
jgi:hypothetical protein